MKKKRSKAGEGQRKTRVSFLSSIPPDLLEGTAPTTSDEHSSGPGLTPEPTSTVGSHSGWTRFLSRLDRHHKYSPEVIPVVPQPFQDHSSPRPQSPDSDAQGQILPGSQSDTGTECRDLVNLEALGLPNIGNSCFLNATLQCLLVLPVFLQEIHRQRIENLSWLSSCYNLHSCLSEVHYSCQPGSGATEEYKEQILRTVKYLLACQDRKYLQDSQQDAHELLVNMLCLLRVEGRVLVELNQGYISPVSHLEFLMASVLSCTSCGRTSSNSEDYNHLSLDISPEGTLQDCLALNFKEDPVTSSGYYQLTGILSHLGGFMLSGHYVSDIRAANGKWLRCNDSMVSVSSEASVLRSRARSAYLLFYVYRTETQ
ncbi:hypothetical protein DPEC_G00323070 [Dallia pectoralis]|uniref:Uncharacterized protein n=1 Tax=Dallia pectoralis TaxID=75939 RepID=A0ACC2FAM0_DALPE|nr:hypothetical protein DPEC_G00323070 [Dallia pectoralis]